MEHVVFYPSADGTPAFRRVASLEDAVSFVEHLRNVEGTADFSVYSLAAVPLAFRAYYHVEVGNEPGHAAADPAPAAQEELAAVPVQGTVDVLPAEAAPAPVVESAPAPSPIDPTPFAEPPAAAAASAEAVPAAGPTGEPQAAATVDPATENVVPVPSGRRSMGFFARS